MTYYKVRLTGNNLFHTGCWATYNKEGKRFSLKDARLIQKDELPKPTEIVMFIEQTIEVGTISKNGNLNVSLNQTPYEQGIEPTHHSEEQLEAI